MTNKEKIIEKIENRKFNCPDCKIPHNLSSKEVDFISNAIDEAVREERERLIEDIDGIQPDKDKIDFTHFENGFENAINKVKNIINL